MADAPLRLILGSASPRRADLLRQLELPFRRLLSPDEEPLPADHAPAEFVLHSALSKARSVHRLARRRGEAEPFVVIGADTVVVLAGRILGKPADPAEAEAMLASLAGRTHQVYTGISLIRSDGKEWSDHVATQVQMRPLTAADIAWYVASGEPLDKAGAYGIQGLGARFIESVEGCYYNVVGLPLARLCQLLARAGYRFPASDPAGTDPAGTSTTTDDE